MDPFSSEGELVNIHTAFHQNLFQNVIDTDVSSFSESNTIAVQLLRLRSRIALQQYDQALSELKKLPSPTTEYKAVERCLAYLKAAKAQRTTVAETALQQVSELSKSNPDNANVQILCATALAASGNLDDALACLAPHKNKIDVVAMAVQLHLLQNRLDLAKEELEKAKQWAQDDVVVNMAEAWVYLREGGEKYQLAYYVFEELASTTTTQSVQSLMGQAVSEIHLDRLEEAELALNQAQELARDDKTIQSCLLANKIVVHTLSGKAVDEELSKLDPEFILAKDLAEKKAEFADLLTQYQPAFAEVSS